MIQRGNSITYDNSLSKEMIYTDYDLANLNRRSNQDQLIDALENFKGSNALMYETNNEVILKILPIQIMIIRS